MRGDGEHLALEAPHDVEAAVTSGSGVIGMAFEPGTDFEDFLALERTIRELVQAMNDSNAKSGAAAETARRRDVAGNRRGERERLAAGPLEKSRRRGTRHGADALPSLARNGHVVVKVERKSQAVEAGPEVGSARRNADGDLLHDSERSKAKRDAIVTGTA